MAQDIGFSVREQGFDSPRGYCGRMYSIALRRTDWQKAPVFRGFLRFLRFRAILCRRGRTADQARAIANPLLKTVVIGDYIPAGTANPSPRLCCLTGWTQREIGAYYGGISCAAVSVARRKIREGTRPRKRE